ncbi:DUF305 domain-containing protein [Streptomyces sp. NBC_00566]|uniref:DUF305 domain-containing protein n=1 Tax=Streptomyces sp. NBC_00566 TaxID=2975778 RepID=UPI002E81BF05|nr:DUF305 domain-containing protein [Streptomyces sp. NBC_00566]WUB89916.1 DUF305 domain-containing protein [Streptomyces sp. NBC_00566]
MTTSHAIRRAALGVATVSAVVLLAACGGEQHPGAHGAPAASAETDAHNAQDVTFAQGMIPHHQQALEMARLAPGHAASAEVKALAARIEKAQDPEIRAMTGWLRSWGEEPPMAGMDHSRHGGMAGMSGMMSADDMTALEKSTGADFDQRFLTLMIAHHQGAVEMAKTEKAKGRDGRATRMADDVIAAQSAEIKQMKGLLGEK